MADTHTLHYAQDVNDQAETLYDNISYELAMLSEAYHNGQNTLDKLNATSHKTNQYANELTELSRKTQSIAQTEGALSTQLESVGLALMDTVFAGEITSVVHSTIKPFELTVPSAVTALSVPSREQMQQAPLPSLEKNQALWDELAGEFSSFSDEFNRSLQEIEKLTEASQHTLQQAEKPQNPKESVKSHQVHVKTVKE